MLSNRNDKFEQVFSKHLRENGTLKKIAVGQILKGNLNRFPVEVVQKAILENRVALGATWHNEDSSVGVMGENGWSVLDADLAKEQIRAIEALIKLMEGRDSPRPRQ